MKKLFLVVFLVLTGCQPLPPVPTATPTNDDHILIEALQAEIEARVTERAAAQVQIEHQAKQTATALIAGVTATEASAQETKTIARVTIEAAQAEGTSTAQAASVIGTSTARAASDQATSTAAAAGTSTEIAYKLGTATVAAGQTAVAATATAEAPFVFARHTSVYAQSESADLAVQRERMTNNFWAWTPLILIFAALIAGMYYLWKKGKIGIVPRDDNGMLPALVFTDQMRVLLPDLQEAPVMDIVDGRQIGASENQSEVKRRAQAVEAISQLPPGYQRQALDIASGSFGVASNVPKIEIVDENIIQGWVDDVEGQV
ncbi:MAG TPA: hypothetical protein DCG54_07505 [Anaerolineae bacterium]|nr:hypothetical protein [Anaerolineae bacterium]